MWGICLFFPFFFFPPSLGYGHTKYDFGSVHWSREAEIQHILPVQARKQYLRRVKRQFGCYLQYRKLRCTKCKKDIWAQTSQLPCFGLWKIACYFVNGTWIVCMFLCVCDRAFVYELSHCFHFRRNKINPFDIPALSLLGCISWWIIQIWQRVLSALKLHFSTDKLLAGRCLPTLVGTVKAFALLKPEEKSVWLLPALYCSSKRHGLS